MAKRAGAQKKPHVSTHPAKVRSKQTLAVIERLRRICKDLPDVTEQIAWGEFTWRSPKIFAMTDTYHHGSAHLSVHLPAPPGAQAALIDSDGARFFRSPYTGGKGWIGVVLDTRPDWAMVESLVGTAYDLIKTPSRARRR
jgi:predicted DNA-binding protein (MmcQ/YjbR family)